LKRVAPVALLQEGGSLIVTPRLPWHFLGFPRGSISWFWNHPASIWFSFVPSPHGGGTL